MRGRLLGRTPVALRHCVVVYFVASGVVLAGCTGDSEPLSGDLYVRDVSGGLYDTAPVRGEAGPLRLHRDGDAYECSMCHDGFRDDPSIDPLRDEHSDIVMKHGLDGHCLHCHNPSNSDVYLNHDGTEIPGDQSTLLCGKCHGVTFKDWQVGVHGRQDGFWDAARGPRVKLECIQCHDPHAPVFPQLVPDPAPIRSRFEVDDTTEGQEAPGT